MATAAIRLTLLALLTALAAACSLTLEVDKKACKKDTDCGGPYLCSAGLCKRRGCQSDTECRALGGAYATTFCEQGACYPAECGTADLQCEEDLVCDTARNHCTAPSGATCNTHGDCDRYAGLPVCRDGACQGAECEKAEDCTSASPTVTCEGGRCQDPIWGCAGEPDERAAPMSKTATFKVEIVDLLQRMRIPDLAISLCSSVDTLCQTPLREPDIVYDEAGLVTITGLPQNSPVHLKLEAEGYITSDFYVQRLVRDVTEEPQGIQLLPTALYGALSSALGVEADLQNKATFSALFLDCQSTARPGAGVSLTVDDKPEDVHIYYVRDGNQPDVSLDKTTVIGAAGAVNVPSGRQITLKGYVGDTLITSYAITPYANRMTYVTLYPRVYSVQ
jgi:hypothetical protein